MTREADAERPQPLPHDGPSGGGAASGVEERRRLGRGMQAALPPGSGGRQRRLPRWLRRNADAGLAVVDAMDLAGPVAGAAVVVVAAGWRMRRRARHG